MLTEKNNSVIEETERYLSISTRDPNEFPLVIERGEGVWIYDINGEKFLDFSSGIGVNNLGWPSHPRVIERAEKQMRKLAHSAANDFYNIEQLELAKKLVPLLPGERKVFLSNSGTETIEAALKLVKSNNGKYVISFIGGFHGRTLGSLSLTASKGVQRKGFFPLIPGVIHVPYPNPFRNPWHINGYEEPEELVNRVFEYIEEWILNKVIPEDELSAIFFEPIQGEGGYVVPPPQFFSHLNSFASKRKVLLIDDEVQMGMGRTGEMLAIHHYHLNPDVFTLAKALGGGLVPIGATVFRSELDFQRGGHSNTFGGNALTCAIASETIDVIEEVLPNVKRLEGVFKDELSVVKADDVRGLGLAWGLEFVKNEKPDPKTRDEVIKELYKEKIIALPAGESSIRLIPPLIISEEDAKSGLSKIRKVIDHIKGNAN
ncbi:aspartate aminotransferase family protein [Sulfolobales archaeon HS-7]|nr:aspartate aminotransferase family protein [Sulfolobales archaeon HS-7]